jgi:glycosyltransferase involved in cell wall biosynthesis
MNKPKLTVIIPCYNQGRFLQDALSGVSDQTDIEVIIVNDGSTDQETIEIFKKVDRSKYKVIEQENKGLSATRNIAIENASADYILALDADNIVMPEYYRKAIQILDSNPEVGVVYANPIFFGVKNENVYLTDFNLYKILNANYIDACAVFRKVAWAEAGDYDVNMPIQGYEDWELWIGIAKKGWRFHYLNEHLFKYRVSENSMLAGCNIPENKKKLLNYIRAKHKDLYEKYQFDILDNLNNEVLLCANHIENLKREFTAYENNYRMLEENNRTLGEYNDTLEKNIITLRKELMLLHAKAESMRIKNRIKRIFGVQ